MNENLKKIFDILRNTTISIDGGYTIIKIDLNHIKSVYSITDPKGEEHNITKVIYSYSDGVLTEISGYNEIHRTLIDSYRTVYAEEWFDYDDKGNEIYCMLTDDQTEEWFNSDGYSTHYKDLSTGYEEWKEYDGDKLIYFKNTKGEEKRYN